MKYRQQRLESSLQKILTEFFFKSRLRFPGITINRIELSEGLKSAKIFTEIKPADEEKKILKKLRQNKQKIWCHAASKIKIKFLPQFEFVIDKGEENRRKIEELLSAKRESAFGGKIK